MKLKNVEEMKNFDNYFKAAVMLTMCNGCVSAALLQRKFAIGYSRAARIVDAMEDCGFVAPLDSEKRRKALITPEKFEEIFGEKFEV
ncbi:MAG: hypothetical protein IKD36_02850 [Clostridia bacterium]|nr:hypothetical protein [Clostridia bacterium]